MLTKLSGEVRQTVRKPVAELAGRRAGLDVSQKQDQLIVGLGRTVEHKWVQAQAPRYSGLPISDKSLLFSRLSSFGGSPKRTAQRTLEKWGLPDARWGGATSKYSARPSSSQRGTMGSAAWSSAWVHSCRRSTSSSRLR